MPAPPRYPDLRTWLFMAPAILLAFGVLMWAARRADPPQKTRTLLSTSETVLGQPIAYPEKTPAKVTAAIVVMQPGEETGWHAHDVPLFGYILEGEVTVDYGAKGTRVYRAGNAVMEAIDLAHNGRNTGRGVARMLAVFMGADGIPNTVKAAAPK